MLQEWIVYIIGLAIVAYIGFRIYRMLHRPYDPCASCGGCDLKRELEKKKSQCDKAVGKSKKTGNPDSTSCGCGCRN